MSLASLPIDLFANAPIRAEYKSFDQAAQAAVTPDQALQLLEDGNARIVAGPSCDRDLIAQQNATSSARYPFAVVLRQAIVRC